MADYLDNTDWDYYSYPFCQLYRDVDLTIPYTGSDPEKIISEENGVCKTYFGHYCSTDNIIKLKNNDGSTSGYIDENNIFSAGNKSYLAKYNDYLRLFSYGKMNSTYGELHIDAYNLTHPDHPSDNIASSYEVYYRLPPSGSRFSSVTMNAFNKNFWSNDVIADGDWHKSSFSGIRDYGYHEQIIIYAYQVTEYDKVHNTTNLVLSYIDIGQINVDIYDISSTF